MLIYVYDPDINLLGIVDVFTSLQWVRRYYKAGEFELVLSFTDDAAILQKRNYIWPQGSDEAGIIEYRNIKKDSNGQETIDIKGSFLTSICGRRAPDAEYLNGNAEQVMRGLMTKYLISPADTARTVPHLALAPIRNLTPAVQYQVDGKPDRYIEDSLVDVGQIVGLGHRNLFLPEQQLIQFDVYSGIDRSASQSANPPAIFSEDFENILEQEFVDSDDNLKTVAIVTGTYEWEYQTPEYDASGNVLKDASGKVKMQTLKSSKQMSVTVGTATGIDRRELIIDGGNNEIESGGYMSEADFTAALQSKGQAALAEHAEVRTFESKVNTHSNLIYREDYDLGDKVTCVSKKWGVTIDTQITEITEIYEQEGMSVVPTFGTNIPTLIDKIKQKMR